MARLLYKKWCNKLNNINGVLKMLAVNYSTIRNNLKDYCDKASEFQETIIVTRKNEKTLFL